MIEEARFWSYEGFLRCIRLDELEPEAREAIEFVCGGFFGRDVRNDAAQEANRAAAAQLGLDLTAQEEEPFGYRRFAGGGDLPRRRYYSVCVHSLGEDGGALENELASYAEVKSVGPAFIRDTLRFNGDDWSYFWNFFKERHSSIEAFQRAEVGKLLIHFDFRRDGVKFNFADTMHVYERAARWGNQFAVLVPTRVEEHSIAKCVDLRRPPVRGWMMDLLDRGIPGVHTYSTSGEPEPFDVSQHIPIDAEPLGPTAKLGGFKLCSGSTVSLPKASLEPGFARLLAYLHWPQRGGSPVTDAIGRYLRMMGVDALIFPSARSDLHVTMKGDHPIDWGGWNLVDYRDAPEPQYQRWVLLDPKSWMSNMQGRELRYHNAGGERDGTFQLTGPQAGTRQWILQSVGMA